jgi:hypothetical protein
MTPQVRVLPAADRDIDGQAEYVMREASLETAVRFYVVVPILLLVTRRSAD